MSRPVPAVGWHHVMSAEFGMKRHQEWLRTREAQEKNKETVQALFGELRIRDYIWRVITGDYFAFLNEVRGAGAQGTDANGGTL